MIVMHNSPIFHHMTNPLIVDTIQPLLPFYLSHKRMPISPHFGCSRCQDLYLTMINQILASLCRGTIRSLTPIITKKWHYHFSASKDDEGKKGESTVISLTKQEIERMKNILKNKSGSVIEGEQNEGQDFFQGEEVRLSLKLLQIDSIQQLKPLIIKYTQKKIESESNANEIARCKFFILFKYVNLEGSLLSKEIIPLFKDIIHNLKHLDEEVFTVFIRLIANEQQAKKALRKLSPKVVIHPNPSHNNSQLLSLLLMIYPEAKEQIYIQYFLHPTRKIEGQHEKIVVYDPINIVHILSHYFYYDDVQKLFENTMRIRTIEESDVYLEEFIRTDEDFKQRKAQAIIYAVNHEFDQIYTKYLTKEYFDFDKFDFKHSMQLLKSLAISEKAAKLGDQTIIQCSSHLIRNLKAKSEAFITDEEGQLLQNESYKTMAQIIASYMRRKQPFFAKQDMIMLIKSLFDPNSAWRSKFDLYHSDELFTLIVSYKASKDYLQSSQIQLDADNTVFISMLSSFNHSPLDFDPKHLFYICLFAHQLQALPHLTNKAIVDELKDFGMRKGLNATVQQQIRQIIDRLDKVQ